MPQKANASRRRRDPVATQSAILQAALEEFSEMGHSGARVDRVAARAGVSKPMLYDYFGDKDALYAAALRESYVQIRQGEGSLNLDAREPEDAVRALVEFTLTHFRNNPWFIKMLNTENLLGGETIRKLEDVVEIQSTLVSRLELVLEHGAEQGLFRSDITAVEFYILVASLCYFPVSNIYTLRTIFQSSIDDEWLDAHAQRVADVLLAYLKTLPE